MEMEKNIIQKEIFPTKVNFYLEKEMEKGENIIMMAN